MLDKLSTVEGRMLDDEGDDGEEKLEREQFEERSVTLKVCHTI